MNFNTLLDTTHKWKFPMLKKTKAHIRQSLTRLSNFATAVRYPELKQAFAAFSHLTQDERVVLYDLAKGSDTVLEIGSYLGASACCFGAAIKHRGAGRVYCIDTWENDGMSEGRRNTFAEFTKTTSAFEAFIHPIRGYSTEVASHVKQETDHVNVLFIDGDHSYAAVKADWEAYKGFLRRGSKVIFHDYGWAEGVQRVVNEDVAPLSEAVGRLPNMWWGTISRGASL